MFNLLVDGFPSQLMSEDQVNLRLVKKNGLKSLLERLKIIVIGEEQYCNISIATPEWDKDWCHDCVRAFPWKDDARKIWLKKGIEAMDLSSWSEWLKTPEGEYAKPGKFG